MSQVTALAGLDRVGLAWTPKMLRFGLFFSKSGVSLVRFERRQQIADAGIELRGLRRLGELGAEERDVAFAHRGDPFLRLTLRVARQRQQLAHDLRIGLPVEAVAIDGSRRAHFVEQGAMNGSASRAVGPKQRAVDVEEDQPHY